MNVNVEIMLPGHSKVKNVKIDLCYPTYLKGSIYILSNMRTSRKDTVFFGCQKNVNFDRHFLSIHGKFLFRSCKFLERPLK